MTPTAKALAMDPETVRRECAASLETATAKIIPFEPARPHLTIEQAAEFYLRTPTAPNGFAKALAAENGLNYGTLMNRITELRHGRRFA